MKTPIETTGKIKTVLIIGATGGIGKAVAEAMLKHGWRVRALTRRTPPTAVTDVSNPTPAWNPAIEWCSGDAMHAEDVLRAAAGVDCIVHAANPPRYTKWRELALPMLSNAIAAARATGARLILPGNLYNFGPDAWPLVSESSPQNPTTRKGRVRVEMEGLMQQAAQQGVRTMVVRAGDYFGGHGPSSWFSTVMVKPGKALKSVNFLGEKTVGHAWAYLPDLAETITRLAEKEKGLAAFEVFHFSGHWTPHALEMAASIRRASGNPALPIRPFPWLAVYLAAPFVKVLREMMEMRYLWTTPVRLDNKKLLSVLGEEPHTELDEAVRTSLGQLGCI